MKRILVIEDNPDNLLLMEMLLSEFDIHLHTETDGPSGIKASQEHSFDLILLDIQLPGMDGYQVVRTLRSHPVTADIPILAVTSHAMAGDRERALMDGFTEYLEKPLDPDTFSSTVQAFL